MKYKFWDRQENIITISGVVYTPDEYIAKHPWLNIPDTKLVIADAPINGVCGYEYTSFVEQKVSQGLVLKYGMTDEEVLYAISEFESNPYNSNFSLEGVVVEAHIKTNSVLSEHMRKIAQVYQETADNLDMAYAVDGMPFSEAAAVSEDKEA